MDDEDSIEIELQCSCCVRMRRDVRQTEKGLLCPYCRHVAGIVLEEEE